MNSVPQSRIVTEAEMRSREREVQLRGLLNVSALNYRLSYRQNVSLVIGI